MHRKSLSLTLALVASVSSLAIAQPVLAQEGAAAATPATAAAVPARPRTNQDWWPERLDLSPLRQQQVQSNPYGPDFNYAAEFARLDVNAVKADIATLIRTPQAWWPSDYGSYAPFFIRMAWHSAGTYRVGDGRGGAAGGQQRFEPLNSWPDNANLDRARRLLWPIKQKYGRALSWADLMVLTGNVALETMGFQTYGFAGGREDDWEADEVYWGPESQFLASDRFHGGGNNRLSNPLAATQMGLIYVNPEGPGGVPDPLAAAAHIRLAFGNMAMNDEETVALIAGGHTFGKAHGARRPDDCVGVAPAATGVEQQGIGWQNRCGRGNAEDTITSGLEGAWTSDPIRWTNEYLTNLFAWDWVQSRSPAGAIQWVPANNGGANTVPDAHRPGVRHQPIMFTTDLALREDPAYRAIALRFRDHPEQFADAFSRAWFKLTHRDMGPRWRYLGNAVPQAAMIWQDPVPALDHPVVTAAEIGTLKQRVLASGLTVPQLVRAAWAAAGSYRDSDMRGGTNGGRVRLSPQRDWAVNDPAELSATLARLESIRADYNRSAPGGRRISLADMVVLGGAAAIEQAARAAGRNVTVPFTPGRMDASQDQTDAASFATLEPKADGFRNYYTAGARRSPAEELVERADLLGLTVPEMTVLVGGMRVLDANAGGARHGVFTATPGRLTNDFFVNLLGMDTRWTRAQTDGLYEGRDLSTGQLRWTATPVDLVFGSNSELRSVAEVYAAADGADQFVRDFVAAWTKVMENGRR